MGITANSGGTPGKLELWVDGVKLIDKSCVNTKEGTSPTITLIRTGGTIGQPGYDTPAHKRQVDKIMLTDTWQDIVDAGYLGAPDVTDPITSITTSDPSGIIADSLTVTGTASDAVGVSGCKWRKSSAPDADNGTACTGTTSFSCSTSGYSTGANTLYVGCYDAAGNYGSDSIVVNRSAMTVSGLVPVSGTKLAKTTTSTPIEVTTSDAATCRWGTIPNITWSSLTPYSTTGGTTHSSTLPVVAGGVYQLCTRCLDTNLSVYSADSCTSFSVNALSKHWWWRQ
jgi:hypothetical protein